jgi:hypothetical protein
LSLLLFGLPTATAGSTDLAGIARAAGVVDSYETKNLAEFEAQAHAALNREGPSYIVAKVDRAGKRGESTGMDGKESKYRFVRYIEKSENIQIIGPLSRHGTEH